jgi:hypothetical protein
MRDLVGLDGNRRATAVPDASNASGGHGTGKPLEKTANLATDEISRGRTSRMTSSAP